MLRRWPAIQNGLAAVSVSAVFPVRTRPAPTNASVTTKMKDITVVFLIGLPLFELSECPNEERQYRGKRRKLVIRCEYSMTVFNSGADGTTSP